MAGGQAGSSASRTEPCTATGLRSSTVSMSGGKIAAPTPHDLGLDKQDPSVNARIVLLGVSHASFSTTCMSSFLDRDFDEPRVLQYSGVAIVIIKCPSWNSGSDCGQSTHLFPFLFSFHLPS